MKKLSILSKSVSVLLIVSFISSQVYAGEALISFSNNKLAASLISDPSINPARSNPVRNDIAAKAEPGAIGNGMPLVELVQGRLPVRVTSSDQEYNEIAKKLREAIALAVKLSVANQKNIPATHKSRFKQAVNNLVELNNKIKEKAYLYNADVKGLEDYLLGFNFRENVGLSLELINDLYSISPKRLAQYIFHECVPEKGIITERDDHRIVYNEIQSAVFGQDEVLALKHDLRGFINEKVTQTPIVASVRISTEFHPITSLRVKWLTRKFLKRPYHLSAEALAKIGKPSITALVKALEHKNSDVREFAAEALGSIGPKAKDAIPALVKALEDENVGVRSSVIKSLGKIDLEKKATIFALVEVLGHEDRYVRGSAAEALGNMGPIAEIAIPALVKSLEDKNSWVRHYSAEALEKLGALTVELKIRRYIKDLEDETDDMRVVAGALGEIGSQAKAAIPALINVLSEKNLIDDRNAAAKAISKIGPIGAEAKAAIPALMNLLKYEYRDFDDSDRPTYIFHNFAYDALAKIGKEAIPALVEALKDRNSNDHFRKSAAETLAKIGKDATSALTEVLAFEHNVSDARKFAAKTLGEIGPEAKEAIPALIKALECTSSDIIKSIYVPLSSFAASALGKIGPEAKEAIPALIKNLEDRHWSISESAAEALCNMGVEAKAAIPALKKALENERQSVRRFAAEALDKLGVLTQEDKIKQYIMDLKSNEAGKFYSAIRELKTMGPLAKNAVPTLIELLNNKSLVQRCPFIEILGEIGPEAKSAVRALTNALEDRDLSVREAAKEAIRKIESAPFQAPIIDNYYDQLKPAEQAYISKQAEKYGGTEEAQNALAGARLGKVNAAELAKILNIDIGLAGAAIIQAQAPLMMAVPEKPFDSSKPIQPSTEFHPIRSFKIRWLIRRLLKSKDVHTRKSAAELLGKLGTGVEYAIPALVKAIEDKDSNVRKSAAEVLEKLNVFTTELKIKLCMKGLEDNDRSSIDCLVKIGELAVPALIEALNMSRLAKSAAGALSKIGPKAKAAVPILTRLLEDKDSGLRGSATEALGLIGDKTAIVIYALTKKLEDKDYYVREYAMEALEKFGALTTELKIKRYIKDLQDNSSYYSRRISAAENLGAMGSLAKVAIPELVNAMRPDMVGPYASDYEYQTYHLCKAATDALVKIGKDAVPDLERALWNENAFVRSCAIGALGNIGPAARAAIPALIKKLEDRDNFVSVAKALSNIGGPETKAIIPALRKRLTDESFSLNGIATLKDAIRKIESEQFQAPLIVDYYSRLKPAEQIYVSKFAEKYGGTEQAKNALAGARLGKVNAAELAKILNIDIGLASAAILQAQAPLMMAAPEKPFDSSRLVQPSAGFHPIKSFKIRWLIRRLASSDSVISNAAVDALGNMGVQAKAAIPALVRKMLEDKYWVSRINAAEALEKLGFSTAEIAIRRCVDRLMYAGLMHVRVYDSNYEAKIYAVQSLVKAGKTAVPPIMEALEYGESDVREFAAELLGKIGAEAKAAVPRLVKILLDKDEESRVRKTAAQALICIGPGSKASLVVIIPDLINALKDKDYEIRTIIANIIGMIGPKAKPAIPGLIKALVENQSESEAISEALGKMGSEAKEAAPYLIEIMKNTDLYLSARRSAAVALEKVTVITDESKLIQLIVCSEDYESKKTLIKIGKPIVASLIKELESKYSQTRYRAAQFLAEIGPEAKDAIPVLRKVLLDDECFWNNDQSGETVYPIRNVAREAIRKIESASSRAPVIVNYYNQLQSAEQAHVDKQAIKYGGTEQAKNALAGARLGKVNETELAKILNIDIGLASAAIIQAQAPLMIVVPEESAYSPAVLMIQISEDLPTRAKLLQANLTQILSEHPDQLFFMGIETGIGESQKAQIMPLYKAIDEIKDLKDSNGKSVFPNLMVRRARAEELAKMTTDLVREEKLNLNNVFIGARKISVDNKIYDAIGGEGRAWISAIDDSRSGDYLPVFEAITLNMMAYLNADMAAIKNFYDAISDKPIDPGVLQDMIRNRIIYVLPRATKFDTKQLRELYELAKQIYVAA